jgi:transposase
VAEQKVLCVGIDVSSRSLQVAYCDGMGTAVGRLQSFANDAAGVRALCQAVTAVAHAMGRQVRVIAAVESTGDFHRLAARALSEQTRLPVEVHVLNPREVKWFRKLELKDSKTDRVDAELIARFLAKIRPQPRAPMPQGFEALQDATRTRRRCIEERTALKNRLHRLLRTHLPGYREALGAKFSVRTLVVLAACPSPHDLLRRGVSRLAELCNCDGKRIGPAFAQKVIALAKAAPVRCLPAMARLSIQDAAARILQLNRFLHGMDAAIAAELERLFPNNVLLSVPGLGPVSVASVLAEVGDIRRFPDKEAFVGYCGLYPVAWESGDTRLRFRMTRKGNRMLKMTLLVASAAARQYNPTIRHFYARLRAKGKGKKAAGGAIARKLAEVVWAVLTANQPWSQEIALRGIARGEEMAEKRRGERRLTGDAAGQAPTESGRPHPPARKATGTAASRSRAPHLDSTISRHNRKVHRTTNQAPSEDLPGGLISP